MLMRSLVRAALLTVGVSIAATSIAATEARAGGPDFTTGYNQAWLEQDYGHDMTSSFAPQNAERLMQRVRASGGLAVRLWLFEGRKKEGILWQGTRAVGVDPAMLQNVEIIMQAARRHGVKVYWTALSANWVWPQKDQWAYAHYNLLNNKYGCTESFKWNVLLPILDRIMPYSDSLYGLDLLNEVQAAVKHWQFSKGWKGAQAWIEDMVDFVHFWAPGLPVTASSGHSEAVDDLLAERFCGLGLDFYDVHLYNDQGSIPRGWELRALAQRTRTPIVLGEFGQRTETRDDELQRQVTWYFLWRARNYGFTGAFAWRLDDDRDTPGYAAHHSYYIDGRQRPAVWLVRYFSWYFSYR
ncbi:hypothetical protein ACFL59_04230 [Planctomycetota bacterium]